MASRTHPSVAAVSSTSLIGHFSLGRTRRAMGSALPSKATAAAIALRLSFWLVSLTSSARRPVFGQASERPLGNRPARFGAVYPVSGAETLYPALDGCWISHKRQFLSGGVENASFLFGDSNAESGGRFGLGFGRMRHILSGLFGPLARYGLLTHGSASFGFAPLQSRGDRSRESTFS